MKQLTLLIILLCNKLCFHPEKVWPGIRINGLFVRFSEAEGRYTKVIIKGFKPFSKVYLTNMLEYNENELPVTANGNIEISVKPWEIVNIKIVK